MSDFNIRTTISAAPSGDNIIVEQFDPQIDNPAGLDLSQAASLVAEEVPVGVVMATGPDVPEYIIPGQVVMVRKYTGTQVVVSGTVYHVYSPRDILLFVLEDPSQDE